jgi:hypothetical protein
MVERVWVIVLAVATTAGCGTYSMMRSADTLKAGRVELAAGLAASQLGDVDSIFHGAVGITDHVELLAQNEVYNSFAEVRYGILHSDTSPVALAVGLGAGYATTLLSDASDSADRYDGTAATASLAIGKTWQRIALTLMNRTFLLSSGDVASSTRFGARLLVAGGFGIEGEVGGTTHVASSTTFFNGEASFGLFFGF